MNLKQANILGYYLVEGDYSGTTDNRIGRWYWLRPGQPVDKRGKGFATRDEALEQLEYDLLDWPEEG